MTDTAQLRALLAKMTPGTLIAAGWGNGSTLNGMTNIFNEDAEVLLMECIPEHDAAGIVALVNAAEPMLDEIERLRAEVARLRAEVERQRNLRGLLREQIEVERDIYRAARAAIGEQP